MTDAPQGFDTLAIHAGTEADPATGARQVPIYQTTAYVFRDADHAAALFGLQEVGYIYSRLTNPTVSALEEKVASLEGGTGAVACASGHAAQMLALQALMEAGDEMVAGNRLYGGSITQFSHTFRKFGWTVHFADATDPESFRAAMTDKTKAIFVESLANPGGVVVDLEAVAAIAHEHGVPLIVDNTMATPYLCRPFEWGADIVIHSATKFLGGHGNSLGGIVVDGGRFDWAASPGKYPALSEPTPSYHGLRFYETFGEDARTVSRELDIVLTARDRKSKNPVPLAGIPYHALDSYLAKLIRRGYRVAICDQLEDPQAARGLVKRGVVRADGRRYAVRRKGGGGRSFRPREFDLRSTVRVTPAAHQRRRRVPTNPATPNSAAAPGVGMRQLSASTMPVSLFSPCPTKNLSWPRYHALVTSDQANDPGRSAWRSSHELDEPRQNTARRCPANSAQPA